jgi:hypothetical protein
MDFKALKARISSSSSITTRRSELAESKLFFEGKPISYKDFKFSKQIIDTKSPSVVFKCGRQTAKSMTLSTVTLTSLVTKPYRKFLYVSPTQEQTKVFSNDKVQARLNESKDFKKLFVDRTCTRNVYEKSFLNDSRIYFRSASVVDSIRGISVHVNLIDEIQDIPLDNLAIIEETMSGQETPPESWYAGTPKTIHNGIEAKWRESSQIVPILVCPAGHHNVPSLEMIQRDALRCARCKEKIDLTKNESSYLRQMGNDNPDLAGFWIPQIALPRHVHIPEKWRKLVWKKENYSNDQFLNEVMGISAGEGAFLIQEKHLVHACRQPFSFSRWEEGWQAQYDNGVPVGIRELWMGVDWGHTASRSYTIAMVGGYDTKSIMKQTLSP